MTTIVNSGPTPRARVRPRFPHALPALFFLLLVLALNYPLVLKLNSHVVGRPFDDTFEVLWQLSTVHRAVFETHSNPFYTPNVFYPQGWYTASGAQPPWYLLLLSPLTAVAGPVLTYNLTVLATFILGGFGVYWVVRRLTGQTAAGLIAGCAYIAAPVFTLRLGGHLHTLLAMMFLPYAVGAMLRALGAPRAGDAAVGGGAAGAAVPSWRWVALAGVFLAATILSHWYFMFIAALPIAGLALTTHSPLPWRARLARLAVIGVITGLLIAPALLLTLQARQAMLPGRGVYLLSDAALQGFSPDYLFSPNQLHPFWRSRVHGVFPVFGEWDVVSLGYATALLAAAGLLTAPWRQTRPLVVMGLISFILGLGPTLRWRGQRVEVALPSRLAGALAPLLRDLGALPPGRVPILLPDFLLYYALPFYSAIRVWSRFAVPLTLVVALLAGFGVAWLWSKGRGGRAAAVALGALMVFEGVILPYENFTEVAAIHRTVNDWLAAQPAGTTLIEYPLPWVNGLAMYSQSLHGQRVVNGQMSFTPAFLEEVKPQLGEWPNAAALPILRGWGVEYVVISALPQVDVFRDAIWPDMLALDGLCLVQSFPDALPLMEFRETHVFAVTEPGAPCLVAP